MRSAAAAPPRRPGSLWVPRRLAASQVWAAPGTLRASGPPGQWRIRQPCYRLRHARWMDHLDHNDPLVLAFEQQVRARLGQALDVRELVAAIGINGRTLERRTQAAPGQQRCGPAALLAVRTADYGLRESALPKRAGRVAACSAGGCLIFTMPP